MKSLNNQTKPEQTTPASIAAKARKCRLAAYSLMGITVEGVISSYDYGVHDIIVRHLRVRPRRADGSGGDCIQIGGLGPTDTGTYNIMLDHLSLSWGNDEMIDLYHAHHVTVQWCTIEESDNLGHDKGEHNFGLNSAAADSGAISLHHNLWAHHSRRVPCMAPYRENASCDFCNNVIYNCRGGYADDGHGERAKSHVNLYKNYYRRGPQTQNRVYPFALSPQMSYYVRDNYFEDWGYQGHPRHWKWGSSSDSAPRWIQFNNNGRELDLPAKTPAIELVDAKAAFDLVLNKAGCTSTRSSFQNTHGSNAEFSALSSGLACMCFGGSALASLAGSRDCNIPGRCAPISLDPAGLPSEIDAGRAWGRLSS